MRRRRSSAASGRTRLGRKRAAAVCCGSDWAADGFAIELSGCERSGFRSVTFDQVKTAYAEQVRALIAGGVDFLLVETIFDSLNAKAALVAIREVFDEDGKRSCR